MRVANVQEAIWAERQKKVRAGEFGYGDFGSAAADHIIDERDATWTDNQLNAAKAKYRELILSLQQTVRDRNDAIAWIKALPHDVDRERYIAEFQAQDSAFMEAYAAIQPVVTGILPDTGDTLPAAADANFGVAPLVIYAAIAAGAALVATTLAVMYDSRQKYNAIAEEAKAKYSALAQNPELAKTLPPAPSGTGGFLDQIGGAAKTGILLVAGAAALVIAMKVFEKKHV